MILIVLGCILITSQKAIKFSKRFEINKILKPQNKTNGFFGSFVNKFSSQRIPHESKRKPKTLQGIIKTSSKSYNQEKRPTLSNNKFWPHLHYPCKTAYSTLPVVAQTTSKPSN